MAICRKCGNYHLSKSCPECLKQKKLHTKNNNPNQNQRIKNTAIITIAIGVTIITLIMITKEYKNYQEEQKIIKMFYGTTNSDKIRKINEKLEKRTEKTMKELRKLYIPE